MTGRPPRLNWDAQPLGQLPDHALAAQLRAQGHTFKTQTVAYHRRQRGIPSWNIQEHLYSPEEDHTLRALWGVVDQDEIARRLPGAKRSPWSIISRAEKLGLGRPGQGTLPMCEVARMLGVSTSVARNLARECKLVLRKRPVSARWYLPGCEHRYTRRPWAVTEEQFETMKQAYLRKLNGGCVNEKRRRTRTGLAIHGRGAKLP